MPLPFRPIPTFDERPAAVCPAPTGDGWPERYLLGGLTHACRLDAAELDSTGIATRCRIRGTAARNAEPAHPGAAVTCDECRSYHLVDAVRAITSARRIDWKSPATLVEVGHELYATMLRSRTWSQYGGEPHPDGRYRLFGLPIVPVDGLPGNGWRVLDVAGGGTA